MGRKLSLLGTASVLVLGAAGIFVFLVFQGLSRADFFKVAAVTIEGGNRITKKEIVDLSGINIHTNLFAMDKTKFKKRIEAHAWVETASIIKDWPNRLTISIKERKPEAIVKLRNRLYYLDRKGVAFAPAGPGDDMDFPIISWAEGSDGVLDMRHPVKVSHPQKGTEPVEEALLFLRYAGRGRTILPKQSISEIHLDRDGKITLFLVDRPFPIYLGKGRIGMKYSRLAKVLSALYKKEQIMGTSYIRVDYDNNAVLAVRANAG